MADPRYPIGAFEHDADVTPEKRARCISELADAPEALRRAVSGLNDAQLDTPYRDGGWTLRQVVHHLADSHTNMSVRIRLALTEANPPIKTYDEDLWAGLADARTAPVDSSLPLFAALHDRLVRLLRTLDESQLARTIQHPERGEISLDDLLQLYAWHGRHHVAHVTALRAQRRW